MNRTRWTDGRTDPPTEPATGAGSARSEKGHSSPLCVSVATCRDSPRFCPRYCLSVRLASPNPVTGKVRGPRCSRCIGPDCSRTTVAVKDCDTNRTKHLHSTLKARLRVRPYGSARFALIRPHPAGYRDPVMIVTRFPGRGEAGPPDHVPDKRWWERALCASHPNPEWWISEQIAERRLAAVACLDCGVLLDCLVDQYSVSHVNRWNVRGGVIWHNGYARQTSYSERVAR